MVLVPTCTTDVNVEGPGSGRGGIRTTRIVYAPGMTPRKVNSPAALLIVVAVSKLDSRARLSALAGSSCSNVPLDGPSGPVTTPDTLSDSTAFNRKSIL